MTDYCAYAVELRRKLHQCPEIGFDLPKTLAIVKGELDRWGIPYTEEFGSSSVVATINPGCSGFTIGLRADMDALPIEEKTGLPFASRHPGAMHACGHDVHTANLLAVGRRLKDMEDQLRCRVKLLFTPAEEYIRPGSKYMVENGVMDDIDCAVALHVDGTKNLGVIGLLDGPTHANSMGVMVDLYGVPAHASQQHKGVDAVAMAFQFYQAMLQLKAKEVNPLDACLVHVGTIHGGSTNNIVCDHVQMFCSLRAHTDELTDFLLRRTREIAAGVAAVNGGRAEVEVTKLLPHGYNHPLMYRQLKAAAASVVGEENVVPYRRGLGGEDFGFMTRKKPSVFFRMGTRTGPKTGFPAHSDQFDVDEGCFAIGSEIFIRFVLENQDGIEGLPDHVVLP